MRRSLGVIAPLASMSLTGMAAADIVEVTGDIRVMQLPGDLQLHEYEMIDFIAAFDEGRRSLPDGAEVDFTQSGRYTSESALSPAQVAAGQTVNSYLLHVDPVDGDLIFNDGTITFAGEIIGVIVLTDTLRSSDLQLGGESVQYDKTTEWRGLELGETSPLDWIELAEGRRTITIHTGTDTAMDEVRILTTIPSPGPAALVGAGVLCLLRRRGLREGDQTNEPESRL